MEGEHHGHIQITWRQEPPTPAQRRAWDLLWRRLLGKYRTQTTEALGAGIPSASTNFEPDLCERQAAATASEHNHSQRSSRDCTIL